MGKQAATLAAHNDLRGSILSFWRGKLRSRDGQHGERAWQLAMLVVNSAGGCYGLVRPSTRLVTATIG